VHLASD
jgi:chromosome segregation ATPase